MLAEQGNDVTWWSADFSHRRKERRCACDRRTDAPITDYRLPAEARQSEGGTHLLPVRPYQKNISFRRFLSHRDYAKGIRKIVREVLEGQRQAPDVIILSLPPLGVYEAVAPLQKKGLCRIIVDIMDAWPETFERLLPFPRPLRSWVGKLIFAGQFRSARRAYRGADGISAVAQNYLNLAKRYGATCPTHLCYHGTDIPKAAPEIREIKTGEPVRLVYIGALERSYDLKTVFEAIKILRSESIPVRLDIAGGGTMEKEFRQSCQDKKLLGPEGPVSFHGFLDQPELKKRLAQSHLGLVPMDPASGVQVPYKAADYTAAGLPILSCLGNELQDLIEAHTIGHTYRFGKAPSLADAIKHQRNRPDSYRKAQVNAFQLAKESFDRSGSYSKLCEFIGAPVDGFRWSVGGASVRRWSVRQ